MTMKWFPDIDANSSKLLNGFKGIWEFCSIFKNSVQLL